MDQAGRDLGRQMPAQPGGGLGERAAIARLRDRRAAAGPAIDRAAEKSCRATERVEADFLWGDGMQGRQALDQPAAQYRADLRAGGNVRRHDVADHDPGAVFEDLERRAQHRRVGAEPQRPRRQRIGSPQRRQNPVFARHVVGAARQLAGRRAAQHRRPAVDFDQIVEIAEAPGKLPRRIGAQGRAARRQPISQRRPVLSDRIRGRSESG